MGSWSEPELVVAPALAERRSEFLATFRSAEARLKAFAADHGWADLARAPFVRRFEVMDEGASYASRLRELCGVGEDFVVPATYSGALEDEVLLAKTPELFLADYPEGDEPAAWEKLLCHEMVHRLHVRILAGNEEAMGPIWFFEGFALVGAGQFGDDGAEEDDAEARRVLASVERGSYRRYAAVLRRLLRRHDLVDLVARAGDPAFSRDLAAAL